VASATNSSWPRNLD